MKLGKGGGTVEGGYDVGYVVGWGWGNCRGRVRLGKGEGVYQGG